MDASAAAASALTSFRVRSSTADQVTVITDPKIGAGNDSFEIILKPNSIAIPDYCYIVGEVFLARGVCFRHFV